MSRRMIALLAAFLVAASPAGAQLNDLQAGFIALLRAFQDYHSKGQARIQQEWIEDYARQLARARAEVDIRLSPQATSADHAEAVAKAVRATWRSYRERWAAQMYPGFEQMAEVLNGSFVYMHERAAETARDRGDYERMTTGLSLLALQQAAATRDPQRVLNDARLALNRCLYDRANCPQVESRVAGER